MRTSSIVFGVIAITLGIGTVGITFLGALDKPVYYRGKPDLSEFPNASPELIAILPVPVYKAEGKVNKENRPLGFIGGVALSAAGSGLLTLGLVGRTKPAR